ncbi:hypothetical protein CPB85DRAFT_1307730 [Mucidula mucida]|nr:hypothetical protein CPB85DRAFT_1307730 [Mucidula mucida]
MSSRTIASHASAHVHNETPRTYVMLGEDDPERLFQCAHTRFHPDMVRDMEYRLGYPAPGMLNLYKHINGGPFSAVLHPAVSRDFRHRHPGDTGRSSSAQRFDPYPADTPRAGSSRPRKKNREVTELEEYTREILEGLERQQQVPSRANAGPSKSPRPQSVKRSKGKRRR